MLKVNSIDDLKKNTEHYEEVFQLFNEARSYILTFDWCKSIQNTWLAYECGYIIGVFLLEVETTGKMTDNDMFWVIVGDIPPFCVNKKDVQTAYEALSKYILTMEEWIFKVYNNEDTTSCYSISVPNTVKFADMLNTRVKLLKEDFLEAVNDFSV